MNLRFQSGHVSFPAGHLDEVVLGLASDTGIEVGLKDYHTKSMSQAQILVDTPCQGSGEESFGCAS